MLRYKLARACWRLLTFWIPIYPSGTAPIPLPKRFRIFTSKPEDVFLQTELIRTYQRIFGEPPWGEIWSVKDVMDKLSQELRGDCFLVLMEGDQEWPVAGFSWGAILSVEGLELIVESALGKRPKGLEKILRQKGIDQIVYFYEFGIISKFRKGLKPICFLLRPGLEIGWSRGIRQTLFWSTPESKIVPLALFMGYEPIFYLNKGEKKIVFLLNPDFRPLLKIVQTLPLGWVVKWMKIFSHIFRDFKRPAE
jgi:hypothetical protein